ncbi:glycosyltransferase family 4 protein [Pyrococcus kukulkanii]|uniref:glycosyltransferase family 4 protein n=1 Tax=Pyrococcus kukulkanii TaxID=1609559 RepID=UPI003566AD52
MKVLMVGPIEKAGGVSTHTKELTKALRKLGVEVEVYNISPEREYPHIISDIVKLYKRTIGLSFKLIKSHKDLDIVHIQASGPLGGFIPAISATFLKKFFKFPLIVTFHYSNTPLFAKKHKHILSSVLRGSDVFIVVSSRQKSAILKAVKKYDEKIIVVPNGYNPGRLPSIPKDEARKMLGLNPNDRVLLNVALLLEKKGQRYLIDAMDIIVNRYNRTDVRCFIVGKGPLRDKLQKQINRLGLQNHVKLLGFVPDDQLALWMNAADLFVLPSLSEGNPTVMFEALGVGLPFVGTAVGGVPEIITSKDYGLLCPPADPECLAEKILIALEKEWDREKIRKYAEQFTWEKIAKQTLEVYKKLLG